MQESSINPKIVAHTTAASVYDFNHNHALEQLIPSSQEEVLATVATTALQGTVNQEAEATLVASDATTLEQQLKEQDALGGNPIVAPMATDSRTGVSTARITVALTSNDTVVLTPEVEQQLIPDVAATSTPDVVAISTVNVTATTSPMATTETTQLTASVTQAIAGTFSLANLLAKAKTTKTQPALQKSLIESLDASEVFTSDLDLLFGYVSHLRSILDKVDPKAQILERTIVPYGHRFEIKPSRNFTTQELATELTAQVKQLKTRNPLAVVLEKGVLYVIRQFPTVTVKLRDLVDPQYKSQDLTHDQLAVAVDSDKHHLVVSSKQHQLLLGNPQATSALLLQQLCQLSIARSPEQQRIYYYHVVSTDINADVIGNTIAIGNTNTNSYVDAHAHVNGNVLDSNTVASQLAQPVIEQAGNSSETNASNVTASIASTPTSTKKNRPQHKSVLETQAQELQTLHQQVELLAQFPNLTKLELTDAHLTLFLAIVIPVLQRQLLCQQYEVTSLTHLKQKQQLGLIAQQSERVTTQSSSKQATCQQLLLQKLMPYLQDYDATSVAKKLAATEVMQRDGVAAANVDDDLNGKQHVNMAGDAGLLAVTDLARLCGQLQLEEAFYGQLTISYAGDWQDFAHWLSGQPELLPLWYQVVNLMPAMAVNLLLCASHDFLSHDAVSANASDNCTTSVSAYGSGQGASVVKSPAHVAANLTKVLAPIVFACNGAWHDTQEKMLEQYGYKTAIRNRICFSYPQSMINSANNSAINFSANSVVNSATHDQLNDLDNSLPSQNLNNCTIYYFAMLNNDEIKRINGSFSK